MVCRVFKKNKNLKTKLQERALSYEEQMGLLPEPHGSPDILSGRTNNHNYNDHNNHNNINNTNRFSFPESHHTIKPFTSVKREIINLDEYTSPPTAFENNSYSFQQRDLINPSSEQMRSYLTRSLSLKRLEDVHHFYVGAYDQGYDQSEGASSGLGELNDGTSGSDGDGGYENEDDTISLGLESVDWSALLQDEAPGAVGANNNTSKSATSETGSVGGDVTVLLQMKRQNSDLFSSLDLWNYSQIAQQAPSIV